MDLDGLGCRTAVNSGKSPEGEKGKLILHIPVESVDVECYSHLLLVRRYSWKFEVNGKMYDMAVLDRKDLTKGQALSFDGTSSSSSGSSLQFG